MNSQTLDAPRSVEICILDVGHGSCVYIDTGSARVLIDTGRNGTVIEFLEQKEVNCVDLVLISHADQDHVGGLFAMLSSGVSVRRVIWNADGLKHTDLWNDLCYQIDDLEAAGQIVASEEVAANMHLDGLGDHVSLEVLAPRLRLRRLGVGNFDSAGERIRSNTVSAVVRVVIDQLPVLLVPGDLDSTGLDHLRDPSFPEIRAKYLVLPHHGGKMAPSAAGTKAAIKALVEAVEPEAIFVSNGRTSTARGDNPRPEVLEAAVEAAPTAAIACSQLSQSCSAGVAVRANRPAAHAAGWAQGHSCIGSVVLSDDNGITGPFSLVEHQAFLDASVPGARCRLMKEAFLNQHEGGTSQG